MPLTEASAPAAVPVTYWVDVATGNDANPGTEAQPFKTITRACSASNETDTIMVRPGTYSAATGEEFPILLQGPTLMSTGGRDVTTIQGDGMNSIMEAWYGQPGDVISGFTFRGTRSAGGPPAGVKAPGPALEIILAWPMGPSALTVEGNRFVDNHSGGVNGGAVEAWSMGMGPWSLEIQDNQFTWNTTGDTGLGGGLYVEGPIATILLANRFTENSAQKGGGIALLTDDVPVAIIGNHIDANEAHEDGGGIYLDHAGLELHQINDNNLWSNIANEGSGGGLWLRSATAEVKRNDGSNNDAEVGGFAYLTDSAVVAENNLIFGGSAASAGAAWYLTNMSELEETNDTVAENGSVTCDEAIYASPDSVLTITNSIYWNEYVPTEIVGADSVSYSCVRGAGVSGPGVIHSDPKFVDVETVGDPRLTLGSPCIDTGTATGAPATDYFGTVRPKDGNSDGVAKHDMGYHEFVPAPTIRLADRTRFSTAIEIARVNFPRWLGVKNVVIASGDDRAAADPLAASGLCWAYDAPLLLVSGARTPDEVRVAIKQIVSINGPVTLRVVGGPISVPDARIAEIQAYVGAANIAGVDRIVSTGGRYDLAAAIAMRMRSVAASDKGKMMPRVALFANGADSTKFFDALALSPIAAGTGAPILLVTADTVPSATAAAIKTLNPSTRIVGGGPNTISEKVRMQLGATRWAGRTRYDTAIAIANGAVAKGWLSRSSVGVAAKLPDALTGGSLVGREGGVLVLTDGATLTPATKSWLTANKTQIERVYVFGGPLSITEGVRTAIANAIK